MSTPKNHWLRTVRIDFIASTATTYSTWFSSVSTGRTILYIARGVGFLVAIVAILLCFMIMMVARTFVSVLVHQCGVLGVTVLAAAIVCAAMRYRNMSFKVIWTILFNSCSWLFVTRWLHARNQHDNNSTHLNMFAGCGISCMNSLYLFVSILAYENLSILVWSFVRFNLKIEQLVSVYNLFVLTLCK